MSPSHWGRPPSDSTPEAHWEKGERCEELGERIAQQGAAREWALVLFFYAALHYTKAKIIAEAGAWADTHRGREGVPGHNDLVREFLPSQIVPHYMHLSTTSPTRFGTGSCTMRGMSAPQSTRPGIVWE